MTIGARKQISAMRVFVIVLIGKGIGNYYTNLEGFKLMLNVIKPLRNFIADWKYLKGERGG